MMGDSSTRELDKLEAALNLQAACEGIECAMEHVYETLVAAPEAVIALDPTRLAVYASHFWRLAQDAKRARATNT